MSLFHKSKSTRQNDTVKKDLDTFYQEGVGSQKNNIRKDKRKHLTDYDSSQEDDSAVNGQSPKNANGWESGGSKRKRKQERTNDKRENGGLKEEGQEYNNNRQDEYAESSEDNMMIVKFYRVTMRVVTQKGIAYVGEEKPFAELILDVPPRPVTVTFEQE